MKQTGKSTSMNMNMNMSMSMKEYESVKETPSHIIPDGSHVYLPPPSALEKASFFAQSVANYKLIHADESQQQQKQKQPQQSKEQESNLGGKELDGQDNDNDNDNDNEVNNIHPLALASARLQTNGISELSKAINLSSLVHSNEYFAFSNIIDPSLASNNTQKTDGAVQAPATNIGIENAQHGHTNPASVTDKNASAAFALDDDFNHNMNENENEPILRSKFILKRKRQQFQSSTFTLRQHYKRLKVVTAAQKVLDQRYLQLRKRWKLSAPEHGSVVQAPVRPNETVAIDVDIYNQRQGQGQGQNEDNSRSGMMNSNAMEGNGEGVMVSTLGKITRMVPRYATIELAEHFDVSDLLKVMKGDGGGDQGNNANENGNATENKIGNANTPENATENENVTENANENNPDAGAASTKKSGPSDMDVDADADGNVNHGPDKEKLHRVAIVGGGITAAHKALELSRRYQQEKKDGNAAPSSIHLISRHPLKEQQFDTHQDWMMDRAASKRSEEGGGSGTPKCQVLFQQCDCWKERRKIIAQERIPGTVTPAVHRGEDGLNYAIENGDVEWHQAEIVDKAYAMENGKDEISHLELTLSCGQTIQVDRVLLATGFKKNVPGGSLVRDLVDNSTLNVSDFCGYPIVDENLLWDKKRIYVAGALAELELGPSARNIAGARLAAERIVQAFV
mmetsp:Transcript_7370/g.11098  ORF Transcript_7370/g.11098 Transcript_7370/m.11098 type:complete len:682 (-) Transcript_7370:95-2140(-)